MSKKSIRQKDRSEHLPEGVSLCDMALHNLIDFSPIVDVGQPARGVKHEVFHQTAHDVILIVSNQNLLEFIIGAVLLSTGQFANGIDRPGASTFGSKEANRELTSSTNGRTMP